jgi:hypothetical protein
MALFRSKVTSWLHTLRVVRYVFEEDKTTKLVWAYSRSLPALLALRTLASAMVHPSAERTKVNSRFVHCVVVWLH